MRFEVARNAVDRRTVVDPTELAHGQMSDRDGDGDINLLLDVVGPERAGCDDGPRAGSVRVPLRARRDHLPFGRVGPRPVLEGAVDIEAARGIVGREDNRGARDVVRIAGGEVRFVEQRGTRFERFDEERSAGRGRAFGGAHRPDGQHGVGGPVHAHAGGRDDFDRVADAEVDAADRGVDVGQVFDRPVGEFGGRRRFQDELAGEVPVGPVDRVAERHEGAGRDGAPPLEDVGFGPVRPRPPRARKAGAVRGQRHGVDRAVRDERRRERNVDAAFVGGRGRLGEGDRDGRRLERDRRRNGIEPPGVDGPDAGEVGRGGVEAGRRRARGRGDGAGEGT